MINSWVLQICPDLHQTARKPESYRDTLYVELELLAAASSCTTTELPTIGVMHIFAPCLSSKTRGAV